MRIPTWFVALTVVALVLCVSGVALADEAKGKVKSAEAEKVVVTDKDGKDWTFIVAKDAKITVDGKETKAAELKKDAEVTVTFTKKDDKLTASAITSGKKP